MQIQTTQSAGVPALPIPGAKELASQEVTLRHLKTTEEIATVLHLRSEIDLSVHAAAGAEEFARLEKKETSAASSTHSS